MAKKLSTKKSSLLAKYTLQYQKKPKSRVFAPLAETYRKLGLYDDALKILRAGLKHHPTYTLGYIVLAHIYFDQQNYDLAYNTLRPFVTDNLENITLQKLFADICINLGYLDEALQTYKYLLLINPKDKYVAEQVKLLEDDLLVSEDEEISSDEFIERRMKSFDINEDDWIQVDFAKNRRKDDSIDEVDNWHQETQEITAVDKFKNDINNDNLIVNQQDLNDDFFKEDYDNFEDDIDDKKEHIPSDPIITHTLVDLYCKQGHYDKAIEILDSILKLHPEDRPTQDRIKQINTLIDNSVNYKKESKISTQTLNLEDIPNKDSAENEDLLEESGHNALTKLVDDKKQKDKELLLVVKEKLEKFAESIKIEATRKQLKL